MTDNISGMPDTGETPAAPGGSSPPGGHWRVVVNHEDQYSVWPTDLPNPAGWRDEGFTGPKEECLGHIDAVWTDMRPRSLRMAMESE